MTYVIANEAGYYLKQACLIKSETLGSLNVAFSKEITQALTFNTADEAIFYRDLHFLQAKVFSVKLKS